MKEYLLIYFIGYGNEIIENFAWFDTAEEAWIHLIRVKGELKGVYYIPNTLEYGLTLSSTIPGMTITLIKKSN